jgi:hypothetical protein
MRGFHRIPFADIIRPDGGLALTGDSSANPLIVTLRHRLSIEATDRQADLSLVDGRPETQSQSTWVDLGNFPLQMHAGLASLLSLLSPLSPDEQPAH